jgi:hypothetical protein
MLSQQSPMASGPIVALSDDDDDAAVAVNSSLFLII